MITIALTLTLFSLRAFCPDERAIYIEKTKEIQPYEKIWNAVCKVESNFDIFAIGDKHLKEWSYGISQIRRIRLDDYYARTGIRYYEKDLFDPVKSKEIFMYFADQIGPYDLERVAKSWNGSGPKTIEYWKRVKKQIR